jgi:hypothetical protein
MRESNTNWKIKMETLLDVWDTEYLKSPDGIFPSATDLTTFESLIKEGAPTANVRRLEAFYFWAAIERVDARNRKVGIIACLQNLIEKLKKVPCEPLYGLTLASESTADPALADTLRDALSMLDAFPLKFTASKGTNWKSLFLALHDFTSKAFRSLLEKQPTERDLDFSERIAPLYSFLSYSALMDLHIQETQWWTSYASAQQFARWLSSINHPDIPVLKKNFPDIPIKKIFPYLTPAERFSPSAAHKKRMARRWQIILKKRKTLQEKGQRKAKEA